MKFFKDEHGHTKYFKVYLTLLVLLIISYLGPMLEIQWVMLVTAFGIAVVKTVIVGAYFMHLNIEKKYISYLMLTVLMLLFVFFGGTAGDIMNKDGSNWVHDPFIPAPREDHDTHDDSADHVDHDDGAGHVDHDDGHVDHDDSGDHTATGPDGDHPDHTNVESETHDDGQKPQ